MQIDSIGENLHEMSKSVFWENRKNISTCHLLKILPSMLKVNPDIQSIWNSYEDGNTFLPFFHYSAIIHVNILFFYCPTGHNQKF